MAIQKTEAIVLKTQPFRSTSLIATFFTRRFGKIRALAKGVRQAREMRGALFELFNRVEIVFYEKTRSDLHLVSEASLLKHYEPLRSNLEGIATAGYFAELVDRLTEIHDPQERIFDLLDFSFQYLALRRPQGLARLFEIKLLREIGWLPYLEGCLVCQNAALEKGFFSARQGALVCAACVNRVPDARPIGRETLAAMRYHSRHSLEEAVKVGVSPRAGAELEKLTERFLAQRLNEPLKTRQFLAKIQPALK